MRQALSLLFFVLALSTFDASAGKLIPKAATKEQCHSDTDNEDSYQFCLAALERSTVYCVKIGDDDMRAACRAVATGNADYCYKVHDQELKKECVSSLREAQGGN